MHKILENYPKAAEFILNFYTKLFLDSLTEEAKSHGFESFAPDVEVIANIMETSPRAMFDAFDEQCIYIDIVPYPDGTFTYQVLEDKATIGTTNTYKTRIEAERNVIEAVLPILNDKL